MRRFIAFLAAVLVAWPAIGLAQSVGIGRSITKGSGAGYEVRLTSANAAGTYVIGESFPKAVVGFDLGSEFVGTLYACETTTYSAATCTAFSTALSADFQSVTFDSTRRWYLLTISTAESGANVSYLRIFGGYEVSSSGGGATVDIDGNGLRESSPLIDADGDGSGYVTCTAKDTPDSACKVAGEIIYRDFVDDANCMIRGCGSQPKIMEHTGTIFLRPVAYLNFGCWAPGGTNDPTDPTTHDSTGDTAYTTDCPDGEGGRKQTVLSLAGWGGTIVGAGRAQGHTDTTSLAARGYGRTDATYLVHDEGNSEDTWFTGSTIQSKPIIFGYPVEDISVARSGQGAFTGDVGGWGTIEASGASQSIQSLTTATLCVCTDGASCTSSGDGGDPFDIQSITTGTPLLINHDTKAYSTRTAMSLVTARDAPPYVQGSCSTGHVGVPIGTEFNGVAGVATVPSNIEDIIDSAGFMLIMRDDYFASGAQITNLTIEPQDWWNEPGGDCADTGSWSENVSSGASTDADCDTWHMATMMGYQNRPGLKEVDVRYWHWYAIDGDSMPTMATTQVENVQFMYGNGGAIADPGSGWKMRDVSAINTQFSGFVIQNFGMGTEMDGILIQNSSFTKVSVVSGQNNVTYKNTRIESSEFSAAYAVACGVKNLRIENVYASGRHNAPTGQTMEGLISMNCNTGTAASKSDFIFLSGLREDPPGSSAVSSGTYTEGSSQVVVRMKVDDTDNYDSLGHIVITNSSVYNDVEPTVGDQATAHDEPGCMVAIEDRTSAGGAGTDGLLGSDGTGVGELDTLRLVRLTGNIIQGHPFCVFGQQGMYDDIGQCADYNSTGGPPQTGGPPDDLCDSDGSTPVVSGDSESPLFDAHWSATLEQNLVF